jgi:hypothetical protein
MTILHRMVNYSMNAFYVLRITTSLRSLKSFLKAYVYMIATWTSQDNGGAPAPVSVAAALAPTATPVGARSSHGLSLHKGRLLLVGGEKVARTPIDDGTAIWAKDLSSAFSGDAATAAAGPWVVLENSNPDVAPAPRVAHAQAVVGDVIYVFGGRQGITMEEKPLNDLWAFNLETRAWTDLTATMTGAVPETRSFHKMLAIGTKLYVFAGCLPTGRSASLHCLNTETNAWTLLSETPEGLPGRGGPGFVASSDGKAIFSVGGFCGQESNAVWRFDLASNTWQEVLAEGNDILRPFSVSCGATLGAHLVFFGGEVDPSNKGHEGAGGFTDAVVVLDGMTGAVVPVASASASAAATAAAAAAPGPLNRGWADCAAWGDDKMVVYGGLTGSDDAPLRLEDTWVLTVAAPKL